MPELKAELEIEREPEPEAKPHEPKSEPPEYFPCSRSRKHFTFPEQEQCKVFLAAWIWSWTIFARAAGTLLGAETGAELSPRRRSRSRPKCYQTRLPDQNGKTPSFFSHRTEITCSYSSASASSRTYIPFFEKKNKKWQNKLNIFFIIVN